MFEAYRIAVELSLVNKVSTGLISITNDLRKTDAAAQGLHKNLGLIGMALAGTGASMLLSLKGPLQMAMDYNRELAKLRQMGLGDLQIKDAQKFVTATDIIGTSMQERMKLFVEAQGAFRESGMDGARSLEAAKTMMPVLAQYQVAMGLLGGQHRGAHEGAMRSLNKTVEMMGGLGNTERAKEIADGIFKAVQSSGKMVDERQLKQFVAYGSSATNQLGLRAIFGGLEPIIGELGGSTTAVGLRTAYGRTNGMMSLPPKLMLHEMAGLGMLDATGHKQTSYLANLQSTDAIGYASELLKMYHAHGIIRQTDVERENAIILGTNGAKVYNKIMSQLPVIEESLKAYDKARGIAQTVKDNADSPMMAMEKFHKALADLGLVIGQTVLPVLTPLIQDFSNWLKDLNKFPSLIKGLTLGFVGLASAMTLGGGLMLAVRGFGALSGALGLIGGAGGLLAAGAASPIVLGIAGMAAALGGLTWLFDMFKEKRASDPVLGPRNRTSGSEHHIGDVWHPGHGRSGAGGYWGPAETVQSGQGAHSPYVRSSSPMRQKIEVPVHLNGREIARAVANEWGNESRRPSASGTRFDGSMSPVSPGMAGAH